MITTTNTTTGPVVSAAATITTGNSINDTISAAITVCAPLSDPDWPSQ